MAVTGNFYISPQTHTIQQESNPLWAAGLRGLGWLGPYATKADAKAALDTVSQGPAQAVRDTAVRAGKDLLGAGKDVLGGANLSSWFVRVGEILAGLVLVGIGLNSMLKGKPLQIVTSAAGVAGKAAMF